MLASAALSKATTILNDNNVTWTESELLGWLNEAMAVLVRIRHDANTVRESVQLAAGTSQTLEADCIALIDIVRNLGTDGATPGAAIFPMDFDKLNRWKPTWHTESASATVVHWLRNPLTPREHYVYPPQPATGQGYVERIAAKIPAEVATTDELPLSDQWIPALVDYVCGRAHAKDADVSDGSKANLHMASFYKGLES